MHTSGRGLTIRSRLKPGPLKQDLRKDVESRRNRLLSTRLDRGLERLQRVSVPELDEDLEAVVTDVRVTFTLVENDLPAIAESIQ